jgi:hypothetical protein
MNSSWWCTRAGCAQVQPAAGSGLVAAVLRVTPSCRHSLIALYGHF